MPGGLPPRPQTEADLLNDKGGIPEGFTPIFNGKDLSGWHISKTNHHGTTPDYRVLHGMIVGNQSPIGQGGILLTDKRYKNVEVYMEVKPDWGNDSGLFLREVDLEVVVVRTARLLDVEHGDVGRAQLGQQLDERGADAGRPAGSNAPLDRGVAT